MIRFLYDNKIVTCKGERADLTVLEFLRENSNVTAAKEGCASGDCGACTVVVSELGRDRQSLTYTAINSCITFMSALHGKQLITADQLAKGKELHPVQQAMVDHHGAQCGFCTPGFIMSMFALYKQNQAVDRDATLHALSGNLCRCTGYRPIIDATIDACSNKISDKFSEQADATIEQLKQLESSEDDESFTSKLVSENIVMPLNRHDLQAAKQAWPEAKIAAGTTDLALEYTQQLKPLNKLISLAKMRELKSIEEREHSLMIGAAVTLSHLSPVLLKHFSDLNELIERFASLPIRNQATMGGNVANASPIGDLPPVLLALNASVICDDGDSTRSVSIDEFFLNYKQTALNNNEWISQIEIPLLDDNQIVRAYKISKRFEDDISAVCAVFKLTLDEGCVSSLSCGFGGVAAIPSACEDLSAALSGVPWSSKKALEAGKTTLAGAFTPIDDVRASAEYRKKILSNLWHRFWLETNAQSASIPTRVVTHA